MANLDVDFTALAAFIVLVPTWKPPRACAGAAGRATAMTTAAAQAAARSRPPTSAARAKSEILAACSGSDSKGFAADAERLAAMLRGSAREEDWAEVEATKVAPAEDNFMSTAATKHAAASAASRTAIRIGRAILVEESVRGRAAEDEQPAEAPEDSEVT